jgi:hypothetical protein
MTAFYLIWQDPEDRRWYPTARLEKRGELYFFAYTKGSLASPRFTTFGNMTEKNSVYISKDLFPIFANRALHEKRPEFRKYILWSGLAKEGNSDVLELMGRMGGNRATDTLQVYPIPEKSDDGMYRTVCFCHGISHLPEDVQARVLSLKQGEKLYPLRDIQNPYDSYAVALRTGDPTTLVGYLPRHLAPDVNDLLTTSAASLNITVEQVNYDAPSQFKLLCKVESLWPSTFEPCMREEYQTVTLFDLDKLYAMYANKMSA